MISTTATLWHNPRCSKSRAALALLQERGIEPIVRAYLDNPPSPAELHTLLGQLGLPPRQLLRGSEDIYSELGLDESSVDDAAIIAAMSTHPSLIERPILVVGDHAVIGRPPERVLELL